MNATVGLRPLMRLRTFQQVQRLVLPVRFKSIFNPRGPPSPPHHPHHPTKQISKKKVEPHILSCACLFGEYKMYRFEERGQKYSGNYRIYYRTEHGPISPFHDIPLRPDVGNKQVFNMVVEVPRWSNAKMEISTKEPLNPIKQDVKNGSLRFVANCFPHHGYIWNYGAIPQTWENPNAVNPDTRCKGDNDPIDVCEIGSKVQTHGSILQVKVIGCIALIDEGETDWKVLAIDVNDPLALKMNDIDDMERLMPGYLRATVEWFRIYKIPSGAPENQFAFEGEAKNAEYTMRIIEETHEDWRKLSTGKVPNTTNIDLSRTTNTDHAKMSMEDAEAIVNANQEWEPPNDIDPMVHKWHYITVNPN